MAAIPADKHPYSLDLHGTPFARHSPTGAIAAADLRFGNREEKP
jgi:hypothetical protein